MIHKIKAYSSSSHLIDLYYLIDVSINNNDRELSLLVRDIIDLERDYMSIIINMREVLQE